MNVGDMMNNNELVSIIVPVYKVERYLDRCLKSLVNQTYLNIEIILVDDESPDKCPEICNEWAKKDCRIKVIHKKNGGLSDARNKGLEFAEGIYVCFVDSDDYVAQTYVETLYKLICNNNTDMSAVSFKKVYTMDKETDKDRQDEDTTFIYEGEEALRQLFFDDTFANYAWNKMYKRRLFENVRFPLGRKMEDLGTIYKLLLNTGRIVYSKKVLYYYYQREDSILHKVTVDFYRDKFELSKERFEILNKIYPHLIENDIFYFRILLETYPKLYDVLDKYNWKNAMKNTYVKCRNLISTKEKIKYFLLEYCSVLYRFINKTKI